MTTEHWHKALRAHFPFEPTIGQRDVLYAVARLLSSDKPNCTLVLKGYAGTGKTTLIGSIVSACASEKMATVLLAPTGRAAKIMSLYSGKPAYTIHKKIYFRKSKPDGSTGVSLSPNLHQDTLFLVDEASMIGEGGMADAKRSFSYRDLLEDLLRYVFSGKNCRLMLVGDSAQLPPVGSSESPALDPSKLNQKFGLTAASIELTEVMRQAAQSGILSNATAIRDQIRTKQFSFPRLNLEGYTDIERVDGYDLQEKLEDCYNRFGNQGVCIVTRSNKRANLFNMQVRSRVFWQEDVPEAGDLIMVVKNNYHWLSEFKDSPTEFIANGDTAEIQKISRREELFDLKFADVQLRLLDYPQLPPFEAKVILDTLSEDGPSLSGEKMNALYAQVEEGYIDLGDRKKIREATMADPYYNALQAKFAYAVTCHKAQGGQWPAVFIDQGYLTDELIDLEFLRWLYTAMTRATKELYLVNFSQEFFE